MSDLSIKYRNLTYEALIRIIELANELGVTPEAVAVEYLARKAKQQNNNREVSVA